MTQDVLKYGKEMELTELDKYIDRVYGFIKSMKPGHVLILDKIVKPERRDLFISIVKMYMDATPWQGGLTFTRDYSKLKKDLILDTWFKKEMTAKESAGTSSGRSSRVINDGKVKPVSADQLRDPDLARHNNDGKTQ